MMRRVLAGLLCVVLGLPSVAMAQGKGQIITGASLVVGGGVLTYASFDFGKDCGAGYGYEVNGTLESCVAVGRTSVNVHDPYQRSSLERPWMLWTGLGSMVLGVMVLALPPTVQKAVPDVTFSRKGVTAQKTIKW